MSLHLEIKLNPVFDYKKNRIVFVQDGTIFYFPNSSQMVIVPLLCNNEPFEQVHLDIAMFKPLVWWSMSWGWQSFIPLSPSFTSSPFETFCWMLRVQAVDVLYNLPSRERQIKRRYQMVQDDILNWKYWENLITNAARIIWLQFKIPSSNPPLPLSFHYDKLHKSFNVAKKMICVSQDWFVIWMGFLSYIISQQKCSIPTL